MCLPSSSSAIRVPKVSFQGVGLEIFFFLGKLRLIYSLLSFSVIQYDPLLTSGKVLTKAG